MSGSHLSKDFFELVKAIGESKSKQEEDRIILDEVAVLYRTNAMGGEAAEALRKAGVPTRAGSGALCGGMPACKASSPPDLHDLISAIERANAV